MAHAKCAVDKDLGFDGRILRKGSKVIAAHFTGADHTAKAHFRESACGSDRMSRCLCACVKGNIYAAADSLSRTKVGYDKSISSAEIGLLSRA